MSRSIQTTTPSKPAFKSNSLFALGSLALAISGALQPAESAPNLPPELAALDAQFIALQAERVSGPFEAEVAKLNSGYLERLKKLIAEEKAAGNLDGLLALDAEQEHVAFKQTVPETDDEKTPANLKATRQIYREAHAKLVATRAANLSILAEALDKRLAQMESELIKTDRIADAKTVRDYREALAAQTPASGAATPSSAAGPAMPEATPASTLAMKDGVTNSLGMKFLPVKGTNVLFCIHEVRYKDYAAFAPEAKGIDEQWKNQSALDYLPTERAEDHPVIYVCWSHAEKFCNWLSEKEGKRYRLPTDREWSIAAGVGRDEKWGPDTTPATVSKNTRDYSWGDSWPPRKGAGNFGDESMQAKFPDRIEWLKGYDDAFPTTAPVMSFEPNEFGLYDMGGNVQEWCEDWLSDKQDRRVLRGSSWVTFERSEFLASTRSSHIPLARHFNRGFRIVLDLSAGQAAE